MDFIASFTVVDYSIAHLQLKYNNNNTNLKDITYKNKNMTQFDSYTLRVERNRVKCRTAQ